MSLPCVLFMMFVCCAPPTFIMLTLRFTGVFSISYWICFLPSIILLAPCFCCGILLISSEEDSYTPPRWCSNFSLFSIFGIGQYILLAIYGDREGGSTSYVIIFIPLILFSIAIFAIATYFYYDFLQNPSMHVIKRRNLFRENELDQFIYNFV